MVDMDYELEKDLKRSIFKESYFEFFKWAFNILFPNEKYEDTFHIKYLCDTYQKEIERIKRKEEKSKDIIVNIPPRSTKSLITSVCLNAWTWGCVDATIPFIVVSFDEELTLLNAQYCRDLIKSDEFQELFGDVFQIRKDVDAKSFYMNDLGGFRMSKTTGENITGHKGAVIIVDDPQNPKTAEQEVMRKFVIKYYTQSLYNRLTPINLGIRIIIMQRLHEEDLTGYLLKNNPEGYVHICLPAEASIHVKPAHLAQFYRGGFLDPIRLSKPILMSFKKVLGSRGYSGQYEQIPSPDEGGIIKKDWFDIIKPELLTRDSYNEPIYFFVDSAYTEKTENDPTAILVCYKQGQFLYIVDVIQQWLEFPQLCQFIVNYTKRFYYSRNSLIYIEPKANGKSIVQQLRAATDLNVAELDPPKEDKITRAHAITAILESRRVRLIEGPYVQNFLSELGAFPNGLHDDQLDCLVNAVQKMLNDSPDFLVMDWR